MKKGTKVLLIIVGALLLIGIGVFIWGKSTGKLASSASLTKGDVKGKVTDKATTSLLGGVSVKVNKPSINPGGLPVASTTTSNVGDSQGNNYRINGLDPYVYEITFSKDGYKTVKTTRTVIVARALQVDVQMEKVEQGLTGHVTKGSTYYPPGPGVLVNIKIKSGPVAAGTIYFSKIMPHFVGDPADFNIDYTYYTVVNTATKSFPAGNYTAVAYVGLNTSVTVPLCFTIQSNTMTTKDIAFP